MMLERQMVLYEEDFEEIQKLCFELAEETNSKLVFLVDKNGQLIASSGDTSAMDTTSLATLAAGNIAATSGLAKLIGEKEFSILFHEGERDNLHLSTITDRLILVVVFDHRTSLGLVRLLVRKSSRKLEDLFAEIDKKHSGDESPSLFTEITDEDIDNLFND